MRLFNKNGFKLIMYTSMILTLIVSAFFGRGAVAVHADSQQSDKAHNAIGYSFYAQQVNAEPEQAPRAQGTYKEEYYVEQLDGSYSLVKTVNKTGVVGEVASFAGDGDPVWDEVSAVFPDGNMGFIAAYGNSNSIDGRMITADGSLVLRMYFERNMFQYIFYNHASVELQKVEVKFGANLVAPEAPVREGCRFEGWVIQVVGAAPAGDCASEGVPEGSAPLSVNGEVKIGAQSERYVAAYSVGNPNPPVEPVDPPVEPVDPPVEPVDPPVEPVVPVKPGEVAVLDLVARPSVKGSSNKGRTCQDDGYPSGYTWNGSACVFAGSYSIPNTGVK